MQYAFKNHKDMFLKKTKKDMCLKLNIYSLSNHKFTITHFLVKCTWLLSDDIIWIWNIEVVLSAGMENL